MIDISSRYRCQLWPLIVTCGLAIAMVSPTMGQSTPTAPPVSVARPIEREVTEWSEYTGRFEASQRVEIRARVGGYLNAINFVDGQQVQHGDLLYQIDPNPYQAAVARAEATVARAESQAALAKIELQRFEKLIKSNTISQEDVDTRRANLDSAQADVALARAELRTVELDLSFTRITAPIAGRVSQSAIDVGNLVAAGSAGSTLLTTLVATEPVHFAFDVNESEFLQYRRLHGISGRPTPEQPIGPVYVRLLDEREWTREGLIDFADNAFDTATGTLRVRATFANPDALLLPGVFGRLRVAAGNPSSALLIDPKAVLADQSAKIVMTVDAEGIVQPRPVDLGPVIDGLQVVRSGLSADDRVIVSGLLRARPGASVTPQEVPMSGASQ